MKKILFLLMVIVVLFPACTEKITYNSDDEYWTIDSNTVLGPTSVSFNEEHREVVVRNYSGTHMGFDLRRTSNLNIPVVAIPFISQGESKLQSGVDLSLNVWYRAISVFYKAGLGSLIIQTIQLLGLDFINQIEDWMVDSQYEAQIRFTVDGKETLQVPTDSLLSKWKENTKNQTFTKLVIAKRALLEANGINVKKLVKKIEKQRNK